MNDPRLPYDIEYTFRQYVNFKIGTYNFQLYSYELTCPIYGPFIQIAESYYGNGLYATWNYYLNGNFIGKRLDDEPVTNGGIYISLTDLLSDFAKSINKYDRENGRIDSYYHGLPMS